MAEIRKVREQGYAVIDQELEPGLVAVARSRTNMRGLFMLIALLSGIVLRCRPY